MAFDWMISYGAIIGKLEKVTRVGTWGQLHQRDSGSNSGSTWLSTTIAYIVVDNQVEPEFEPDSRLCNWPLTSFQPLLQAKHEVENTLLHLNGIRDTIVHLIAYSNLECALYVLALAFIICIHWFKLRRTYNPVEKAYLVVRLICVHVFHFRSPDIATPSHRRELRLMFGCHDCSFFFKH